MKLRFLLIPITAICIISSCSSCSEDKGGSNTGDNTNIVDDSSGTGAAITDGNEDNTEIDLNDPKQLQGQMNLRIEEQVKLANSSRSNRVETMIASFELGMTKREVKKHMLRMKQKGHLVRVQKSANVFEYVYELKLKKGKSNTYLDFDYSRKGGVYKAVCKPTKFKRYSNSKFLREVKKMLIEWYGEPNFELPSKRGCDRFVWISGNRHVDLYCTSKGVEFVYTDLNFKIPANIEGGGKEKADVKVLM
jgi:hypothetical protein